ncbi:MAG: hypothetical protein JWQ98_1986 [Chlorobi bacterium]|jgi:hypothetical protein|nr:hypothetical protein [Chlorobiota bacterium]
MNKRILAIICLLVALGLLVYWWTTGAHIYNVEQVQVDVVDPLFGTTTKEWKNDFHPGLLGYIGPAVAVFVVLAGWLFWSGRKPKQPASV